MIKTTYPGTVSHPIISEQEASRFTLPHYFTLHKNDDQDEADVWQPAPTAIRYSLKGCASLIVFRQYQQRPQRIRDSMIDASSYDREQPWGAAATTARLLQVIRTQPAI
ncbi:hypothetical protein O1Q74_19480 [Pectobacterium sp. A5351]|nr:hypothetical protein [Pectobacterium sp. A5351]WCG83016.1 hypothetical protein O1Q74_19480 [Pectobacterium sp. A5351]